MVDPAKPYSVDFTTPAPDASSGANARAPGAPDAGTTPAAPGTTANGHNVDFTTPAPEPPMSTADTMVDVGKSAATQGAFGVTADVGGMPRGMFETAEMAGKKIAHGILWGLDKMDMLPEGHTPDTMLEAYENKRNAPPTPEQEARRKQLDPEGKGYTMTSEGAMPIDFPSSQGIESSMRTAFPSLDYTPKTEIGRTVGTGTRVGANMAVTGGSPEGALARGASGFVAGAGSETAGNLIKGSFPEYEPEARVLGALMAPAVANRFAGNLTAALGSGQGAARDQLLKAYNTDVTNGRARMTPEQYQDATNRGLSPTIYDAGGPEVRKLLSQMGAPNLAPEALANFNKMLQQRDSALGNANYLHVKQVLGLSSDSESAGMLKQAQDIENKKVNDRLYTIARNDPSAQHVWTPRLAEIAKGGMNTDVDKAIEQTNNLSRDPKRGITPLLPQNPNQMFTPEPPNVSFWHNMKGTLEGKAKAYAQAGDTHSAKITGDYAADIAKELSSSVGAYDTARGTASAGFGASNAIEAGANFAAKPNTWATADTLAKFNKLEPDEKKFFMQGLGDTLGKKAAQDPSSYIRFLENPEYSERLRGILGDDKFNDIYGHAQLTKLMSNVQPIAQGATQDPGMLAKLLHGHEGASLGLAALAAEQLPEMAHMHPVAMGSAALGLVFDSVNKSLKYRAEMKVAPQVFELAQSGDGAALGKLLQENPAARSVYGRVTQKMGDLAATYYRTKAGQPGGPTTPPPPFASGGKVVDYAAEAGKLVREAEEAHRARVQETKPLLNVPDDVVARALSIANEAI
jgi:hypothetical protein